MPGLLINQGEILAKVGRDREAIANFSHALDIDDKAVVAFRERWPRFQELGDIAACPRRPHLVSAIRA